jgi:hypothetical protein
MVRAGWPEIGYKFLWLIAFGLVALVAWPPPMAGAQQSGAKFGPGDLAARWQTDLSGADGFLFLNGRYVPLPCDIAVDGESLTVNGIVVESIPPAPDGGNRSGGKMRRSGPGSEARRLGSEIVQQLVGGDIVVALPNQPLVTLFRGKPYCDLLKSLLKDSRRVMPVSVNRQLMTEQQPAWNAWLAAFEPTEDFRQRAGRIVAEYDRAEVEAVRAIAASRRLNLFAYPLSVMGMVVTTLGIGHLLSHRPPVDAKSLETDLSPLAIRVLTYSLVLVVIYSALDLTWTILAHQAGQMLELNPLGSHLIENPLHLVAFKMSTTGLAVGLLFVLRKYRKAQLAAWWVCLVCTLLTARWLTISPMMAA